MDVTLNAEKASKGGKIHALTLTDNPGGNPAISPEILAAEIVQMVIEPLVHLIIYILVSLERLDLYLILNLCMF